MIKTYWDSKFPGESGKTFKKLWTLSEDCFQNSVEPGQILLSQPWRNGFWNAKGKVCQDKTILVHKGFMEREGIDFVETSAPLAKWLI